MGRGTKFISETLTEQMFIPEIQKNVGFVNIRAVASEEVTRPHYIDIGVSVIYPNSSVDVAACGAKCPATVKPHDLFPIVEGFYGPLRIPLPRTSAVLDLHFVQEWRTEAAVRSGALMGRTQGCPKQCETESHRYMRSYKKVLPEDCMRAIHPAVPMKGCPKYLGCFRGASLDCSESDVIWRWL